MTDLDPWAVLVATVVAFVLAGAWYAALGGRLSRLSPVYAEAESPRPLPMLLEVVRCLAVVLVVATLCSWTGVGGLGESLLLGLVLWVGFPLVLLAGSVLHEKVPAELAAIHVGDWLVKLLVVTAIVGSWR